MPTYPYKELLAATDEKLVNLHDHKAKSTEAGVNYYLNELSRRHTNQLTQTMRELTDATKRYTHIILWMTVINAGLVLVSTVFVIWG